MNAILTPEVIQILIYAAVALAGSLLQHRFPFMDKLLDLLKPKSPMPGTPSTPPAAPVGHPILDRLRGAEQQMLEGFRQAIVEALTKTATPAPTPPPAK